MSSEKSMIDSATGASPPRRLTRDIVCSPIRFYPLTQSVSMAGRGFDYSSNLFEHQTNNNRENLMVKKYALSIAFKNVSNLFFHHNMFDNEETSSLSLPSSYSTSCDTTPILSSLSTSRPVSLMSLGNIILLNYCHCHDINKS